MNKIAIFGIAFIAFILIWGTIGSLVMKDNADSDNVPNPTYQTVSTPSVTTTQPEYDAVTATGKQATQEVSSNLIIKSIEGIRAKKSSTEISSTIDLLKIRAGLNVGSAPVDLEHVVISITDGTTANNLVYADNVQSYGYAMPGYSSNIPSQNVVAMMTKGGVNQFYVAEKIRDEDASFSQDNSVMNTGDLITIYVGTTSSSATGYQFVGPYNTIGLDYSGLNLMPGTGVNIRLTPEAGASTTGSFVTASSYGLKEAVSLYP